MSTSELVALGLLWYAVFLFSTTVHEAAHALAAHRLGDSTAYRGGQVSLNPLPHIQREPIGTILFPLLTFVWFKGGWMMGWASAPYDPWWADRYPKRAAWMALAGPASNLLLAVLAGVLIRIGMLAGGLDAPESTSFARITVAVPGAAPGATSVLDGVASLLSILFSLNVLLFAFNLLPLPPLDGAGVMPLFLKESLAQSWQEVMRQPAWSLLGLFVAWRLFGAIVTPMQILALNLLYPGMGYGAG